MEKIADITTNVTFFAALNGWKDAATKAAEAKYAAKRAYCDAYLTSEGKTEAQRTNEADLKTLDAQKNAEIARVEAKAAEFLLDYTLQTAKG